jgi:2-C-methyl-D-erythritol 2,4-cyclodiphosphate synthase
MMRVGIGYDLHRLEAGRRLVLGGVEIASQLGLAGHSDADVVLHALMDAMLGAAALGDIGTHFPPDDEEYLDASSLQLLEKVRGRVHGAGYRVVNVDIVLTAERPRISPYRESMMAAIAEALALPLDRIGLKATTNEGVGPEGEGLAMSAHACVLLENEE